MSVLWFGYLSDRMLQVTIMDLKSLHGTYRHNPEVVTGATRLSPNVEYSLNHGDIITLGKEVFRDDKVRETC